jgi:hypothetical protein
MHVSRRFGSWAAHLAFGTAIVAALVYFVFARPTHMRWGASDVEVASAMPGDLVIGVADYVATRAVTIEAPRELVWPWIVQMGQRDGRFIKGFEANRYMLWLTRSAPRLTWCWELETVGAGRTRLVTRVRFRHAWLSTVIWKSLAADLGNIATVRGAMLDVKARAEAAAKKWRRGA